MKTNTIAEMNKINRMRSSNKSISLMLTYWVIRPCKKVKRIKTAVRPIRSLSFFKNELFNTISGCNNYYLSYFKQSGNYLKDIIKTVT